MRLPVAPPPRTDELLSSWLGRIGCRYGLDAPTLASWLDGPTAEHPSAIDDVACDPGRLKRWARVCGVDPARPRRLALAERHPRRPLDWFAARRGAPRAVCPACFDRDHAGGRDGYLRASWALAERCVCPAHGRILIDQCPVCKSRLSIAFRLREGLARPVCAACEHTLSDRAGEAVDGALVAALDAVQSALGAAADGRRAGLERLTEVIDGLWSPLDVLGASRPVLALWGGARGWRCPVDARQVVGAGAPLARLRVPWRCLTMAALGDLLPQDLLIGHADISDESAPAEASLRRLLARAAPRARPTGSLAARPERQGAGLKRRPTADYHRLAREILSSPSWIAASDQPEPEQRRVLGRLMRAALEPSHQRPEARQAAVQ